MNFRRRLKVRRLQKKCSVCKEKASRFQDVPGPERKWYCAEHFKEQENTNGNS
jgi:hypothetical protein